MIRNLKVLGLALCAVFALSALSASVASAETKDLLTSEVNDTFVTGEQVAGTHINEFGTKWKPTANVKCTGGTYIGTFLGKAAESVEVTPSYTGCKAAGLGATVDDGNAATGDPGCKFVLTGTTDKYFNTNKVEEGKKATVHLNCEDKGTIKITGAFGCVITFSDTHPANTKVNQNLLGVNYENEKDAVSGKWDIRVTATVDTITYTSEGCAFAGITPTDEDGFLTTNVTVRGYSDSAHKTQINITQS